MIRSQGKRLVSLLLALFVVFSYLGFMPKEVDAAEVLGSTIKANTVYSTSSVKYKQTPAGTITLQSSLRLRAVII